ncbi:septal ring lytic transglycosylase RlpA family protein [Flavobacterium sp. H122]|uniref:septal ring lytic transglycosylase RlpA family protein n=1 Tax=Flavobacterium sp. H122 TaxID=2529860 RepID=UPI0010AB2B3C|nr:septal ring lytic transglycosylase RlpA family protein [Flavobacterium sp. H122]
MINKLILGVSTMVAAFLASNFSFQKFESNSFNSSIVQDTIKNDTVKDSLFIDSLSIEEGLYNYKLYKSKSYATHYANKFNGRRTASGERFDNNKLTAAHRRLPFGTKVRVTNITNGRKIIVKINDRGPHVKGREIDLSNKAFRYLMAGRRGGIMAVKIELAVKK